MKLIIGIGCMVIVAIDVYAVWWNKEHGKMGWMLLQAVLGLTLFILGLMNILEACLGDLW